MAKKIKVVITTANKLTDKQKQLLKKKLTKKIGADFELVERVDKDVIGGLSLSVDGQIKDATIGSQLDQLESQLNQAEVVTAIPLTTEQKNKILKQIKTKYGNIPLNFKVDKQIIAGIKLNIGYVEFDATLRTKLNKLKTHIMGSL